MEEIYNRIILEIMYTHFYIYKNIDTNKSLARIPVLYFSFSLKHLKSGGGKIKNARLNPTDRENCENLKHNYV